MTIFLRHWGALIIAALALVQPWALSLYRRYFRPGRVEIYETGLIEVGYGGLGASISLLGTLRAVERDVFVRSITLHIVKDDDQSQHDLEWAAFRPFSLVSSHEASTLEMPAGFMLLTSDPRRYNLVFLDKRLQDGQRRVIDRLSQAWRQRTEPVFMDISVSMPGGTPSEEFSQLLQRASLGSYLAFLNEPEHATAQTELDRMCYWDAGTYRLSVRIHTPDSTFTKEWSFRLSDQDERGLRANVQDIIRPVLGQPTPLPLYIAVPEYEA